VNAQHSVQFVVNLYLEFQVIGNMNCDRQCIAVAEELERAFGGWVPPFKTSS
jgi:hypothetical protein